MDSILAIFSNPIAFDGPRHMLLILPLSLAISVVYKTIRCHSVREVPLASLGLWVTMVVGMYVVGAAVWVANWMMA